MFSSWAGLLATLIGPKMSILYVKEFVENEIKAIPWQKKIFITLVAF